MVADNELTRHPPRPETKTPAGVDTAGNIVFMSTDPTDAAFAQALRSELAEPLKEICRIMDLARGRGLKVDFMVQQDQFGRHIPPYINVTKAL